MGGVASLSEEKRMGEEVYEKDQEEGQHLGCKKPKIKNQTLLSSKDVVHLCTDTKHYLSIDEKHCILVLMRNTVSWY